MRCISRWPTAGECRLVEFHVFTVGSTHHKILRGVVLPVEVDVVDFFTCTQRSTDLRLNDDDVFEDVPLAVGPRMVGYEDFPVALLNDERLGPPNRVAPHRAESRRAQLRSELFSATITRLTFDDTLLAFRFPVQRPVVEGDVVPTTVTPPEVDLAATTDRATLPRPSVLALVCEATVSLPPSVAVSIAEWALRVLVDPTLDWIRTQRAVLLAHARIVAQRDGNHYSMSHGGRA